MNTKNDNLDLSRSNANSDEKGHLRVSYTEKGKSPDSRAIPKRFYGNGDLGIAYDTVNEIAHWLVEHPEQLTGYLESMLGLAVMHGDWNDFGGMRENFNLLVDVRIRVADLRGERHLS